MITTPTTITTTQAPTTRNRRHHSLLAGAVAAAAFATTALFTSGNALAPGPADVVSDLTGTTGATAQAVYANSGVPTRVVLWPNYWVTGGSYPAGTPCSNYGIGVGTRTTKVIIVNSSGSQRRCG
jgi:hypothetical protein